jgi:uncharacterized GH25 family protein
MKKIIITALLALLPATLSAHYIWLEREGDDEARIYYGEIQDGEREVSPGKLDKIKGLKIFSADKAGTAKEVANKKTPKFFSATGLKGAEFVVASALDVPVTDMKKYNWGMVKPNYYARFGARTIAAAVKPVNTLDILPVAGAENEFQVFFSGKPLEKEKFMLYAPNTWTKEYKTDKDGKVKIDTPWNGQYVIEVLHTDKAPGKFEDKDYESVRHRATYTFIKK